MFGFLTGHNLAGNSSPHEQSVIWSEINFRDKNETALGVYIPSLYEFSEITSLYIAYRSSIGIAQLFCGYREYYSIVKMRCFLTVKLYYARMSLQ